MAEKGEHTFNLRFSLSAAMLRSPPGTSRP